VNRHGPSMDVGDRHGRDGRSALGLTVEQHLVQLRETLLPIAERCGRAMRDSLTALETLHAAPSEAIERSKPLQISVLFGSAAATHEPGQTLPREIETVRQAVPSAGG